MAGIYLHIPFCKQACHYCDFHFSTSLKRKSEMIQAIADELILRKSEITETVETIYFGGGTPSLLAIDEIQFLINTIQENFDVFDTPEISLEANPDDLLEEKILELADSPINRLSIGIQSFFEDDLKFMNRSHSASESKDCLSVANRHFENITIDLIYGVPNMSIEKWKENLKIHPGEMGAAKILRKLRELLPKESVVTTEVGQHQMWASLFYDVIQPGTFFSSTGLGTMGWGFPASIGAKVARPDVPVVDIAGDGSFSMTENSLATAVLEDIPVIVFVLNNSTLGMVAQWQRTFYDRRMIGVDQGGCPDYVKLAESYGAQGIRAQSMDELDKAIKSALSSDVATVIDIPIDPEEDVLPFVAPGTSLSDMILPS